MGRIERQERYKTMGGAADLVKVETLVPPAYRERLLSLAKAFRDEHRENKDEAAAIAARVKAASAKLPKRFGLPPDVDRIITTSVNVPFPKDIDAATLAQGLSSNTLPKGYAGHFERFLGELPLTDILRFCDVHDITAQTLARFIKKHGARLALHRPDLDEHLDALSHP